MYRSVKGGFGREARLGENAQTWGFWPFLGLKINFQAMLRAERRVFMQKYNFSLKKLFLQDEVEIWTFFDGDNDLVMMMKMLSSKEPRAF